MRIRRSAGAALILLVSGCIASEHGLCPPDGGDQAVFDTALLGDWSFVTDDPDQPANGLKINPPGSLLRFERLKDGSTTYRITTPGDAGEPAGDPPVVAHLVPIGGARFLDVLYVDPKKDVTRHALLKVSRAGDVLSFHLMNPAYFSDHPKALGGISWSVSGRIPLNGRESSKISFELPTLTASTAELRKFLEEHPNDPELWPADWVVRCRRPEARPGPGPRGR